MSFAKSAPQVAYDQLGVLIPRLRGSAAGLRSEGLRWERGVLQTTKRPSVCFPSRSALAPAGARGQPRGPSSNTPERRAPSAERSCQRRLRTFGPWEQIGIPGNKLPMRRAEQDRGAQRKSSIYFSRALLGDGPWRPTQYRSGYSTGWTQGTVTCSYTLVQLHAVSDGAQFSEIKAAIAGSPLVRDVIVVKTLDQLGLACEQGADPTSAAGHGAGVEAALQAETV